MLHEWMNVVLFDAIPPYYTKQHAAHFKSFLFFIVYVYVAVAVGARKQIAHINRSFVHYLHVCILGQFMWISALFRLLFLLFQPTFVWQPHRTHIRAFVHFCPDLCVFDIDFTVVGSGRFSLAFISSVSFAFEWNNVWLH